MINAQNVLSELYYILICNCTIFGMLIFICKCKRILKQNETLGSQEISDASPKQRSALDSNTRKDRSLQQYYMINMKGVANILQGFVSAEKNQIHVLLNIP